MIGPNPSAADAAADAANSAGFFRKFELIFRDFPTATSLLGGTLFGVRFLHRLSCQSLSSIQLCYLIQWSFSVCDSFDLFILI